MLLFIVVLLIVLALVFVALDNAPVIGEPWKGMLKFLAVAIGILAICHRMGWL